VLLSWVHLIALAVFVGVAVGLRAVLLPAAASLAPPAGRELLVRGLKLYSPVQIGALGVLILSGAFQLTDYKDAYRDLLAQELGATLAYKLLASFVLVLLATYQTMGLAHRLVRRHESGERLADAEIASLTRRMAALTAPILAAAFVAALLGVGLGRV
jgi:uncharacterized membrane protein